MNDEELIKSLKCTCKERLAEVKWHSVSCEYRIGWVKNKDSYWMPQRAIDAAIKHHNLIADKPFVYIGDSEAELVDRLSMKHTEWVYNYGTQQDIEDVYYEESGEIPVKGIDHERYKPEPPDKDRVKETFSSYIYMVFVDDQLKYIGKGKGSRYKHPNSGASSVVELNRDYFEGRNIVVRFAKKGLSDQAAILLERDLIGSSKRYGRLYNKQYPIRYNYINIEEVLSKLID